MEKNSDSLIMKNDNIENMQYFVNITSQEIKYFIKTLDEVTLMTMLYTFQQYGIFIDKKIVLSEKEILDTCHATPKCNTVILRWLTVLEEADYIARDDYKYVLNKAILIKRSSIENLWNKLLEQCDEKICPKTVVEYFFNNAKSVKGFINGVESPTFILFPRGEFIYADALYSDLIIAKYLNLYLADIVKNIINKKDRKACVLEVGGGTGSTTKVVLNSLYENNIREKLNYLFTDLSRFFLNNAKNKFSDYSFVEYKQIDIDKNLESQNIDQDSMDIIIAVGVLNNSKNMKFTLDNFNKVLKKGGYLLATESIIEFKAMLISQAFMMEMPNDDRKEINSTFLNLKQWEKQFYDSGFKAINVIPDSTHKLAQFGQKLFLLEKQ
ncbi:class I SAM-dependent methyltransferase [Clostridium botulinum]|uniref:class I SAM-dependent methyltransferase n=1 Tax=Clostridium botulinum TaxID=1491 RepID=UPI0013FC8953|nr:class I SAM-dependent methyltransferase [Clostridium botulinum]MBN1077586.1 class I SAM-dependent methyltransferase [Clostridium botulinum]NFO30770.1 class I SAM-dependent methyltransferase [Clostridium botulinum]NFO53719.1 class I SAM-dependent methyltransferase [Clostridium botulinum]